MTKPQRILRALISPFQTARFVVKGDSMLPSLVNGEWVLAARLRLPKSRLRRGVIVVLRNPVETGHTSIKRVIGLPDEDIRLEGGLLYINEVPHEETYLNQGLSAPERDGEWWTGPDEYVVLGDNSNDSQDSRRFGPVNQQLILGRVWFRCWPLRAWGWFPGE